MEGLIAVILCILERGVCRQLRVKGFLAQEYPELAEGL